MKKLLVLLAVFSVSCSLTTEKTQNLNSEEAITKEEVAPEVMKQRFIDLISLHTYFKLQKPYRIDPATGNILDINFVCYELVSIVSENKALYRHRLSSTQTSFIGFVFNPSVGLTAAKYLNNDIFDPENIDFSQICGSENVHFTFEKVYGK